MKWELLCPVLYGMSFRKLSINFVWYNGSKRRTRRIHRRGMPEMRKLRRARERVLISHLDEENTKNVFQGSTGVLYTGAHTHTHTQSNDVIPDVTNARVSGLISRHEKCVLRNVQHPMMILEVLWCERIASSQIACAAPRAQLLSRRVEKRFGLSDWPWRLIFCGAREAICNLHGDDFNWKNLALDNLLWRRLAVKLQIFAQAEKPISSLWWGSD